MKILQLCMRVPFPPSDGATIAMYNISRSFLDSNMQLKILSFNTNKNFVEEGKISNEFKSKTRIETVNINLSLNLFRAFINIFRKDSYNISRFISEEFENKLMKILSEDKFDIVHMEGLHVSPYLETIRKHSNAKIILRAHNVEFLIWERLSSAAKNPLKKLYLNFLTRRLKKYELNIINSFDAIVPITAVDEKVFRSLGCIIPMHVTPVGINVQSYPLNEKPDEDFSVFHLGSMDWFPNLDAVDWFLKNVYDNLVKRIPDIKIYLAGKNMPQKIKSLTNKNLVVFDRIDNAKQFMLDKTIMIVPLFSGGGMRVKIIEGMAAGKPIVSTSVGAEGINYTDKKNILIADTAQEFVAAIEKLKSEKDFCKAIRTNARKLAEEEYDNKIIGKELLSFYQKLISN